MTTESEARKLRAACAARARRAKWALKQKESGLCIICGREAVTKYYCATHVVTVAENQRRYRKRNPLQYKAHQIIGHAIERDGLKRGLCFCGKLGEAHHDDYTKPLDVKWLCTEHHKEHHRKEYRHES